jgi:hypothetical protein
MVNEFNLTYQHREMRYPSHGFSDYIIIIIISIVVVAFSQSQWKQMNPLIIFGSVPTKDISWSNGEEN